MMGFNIQEIKLISALYKDQQAAVHSSCGNTEWFPVQKGVRQGCILSPYLFDLYMEAIMRELDDDSISGQFES